MLDGAPHGCGHFPSRAQALFLHHTSSLALPILFWFRNQETFLLIKYQKYLICLFQSVNTKIVCRQYLVTLVPYPEWYLVSRTRLRRSIRDTQTKLGIVIAVHNVMWIRRLVSEIFLQLFPVSAVLQRETWTSLPSQWGCVWFGVSHKCDAQMFFSTGKKKCNNLCNID